MERKKIIRVGILFLILIIAWVWALRPKKIVVKNTDEKKIEVSEDIEIFGGIDLRKMEEKFLQSKNKLEEIEKTKDLKFQVSKILRNPLKPWLKKKVEEKQPVQETIIKQSPPDFKVTGILYDNKKPLAVIDNEVKEEGERISKFIIKKIEPEGVIVEDEMGNSYKLKIEYEKGEKNER